MYFFVLSNSTMNKSVCKRVTCLKLLYIICVVPDIIFRIIGHHLSKCGYLLTLEDYFSDVATK